MMKTNEIRRMFDKRLVIALLLLLAAHVLGGPRAVAQPQPQVVIDHEYEYKAAYLYHFGRLCTWHGEQTNRIVIGVLGDSRRFGGQLRRIEVESQKLPERRMVVQPFPDIGTFRRFRDDGGVCHILFVSGREVTPEQLELLRQVIEATRGQPTLIFTESRAFAQHGADVNFYIENNRLKLLINGEPLRLLPNGEARHEAGIQIPAELRTVPSVTITPPAKRD